MIIHVDMDAFFAAIEIRDNPALADQPVVIGGTPEGRGVVSTANYVARKFGIHSAMPSSQAKRLCPHAVFLKPNMEKYAAVSRELRALFQSYTGLVEPLSLDEAFLDVGPSQALFGDAVSIAKLIKKRIEVELGLTASAGVAPNKFLAKLASDLQKPNGLVVVQADSVQDFLSPLAVSRLWGVGKQTLPKFHAIGVHTIGQLRELSLPTLKTLFGSSAEHYWRLSRGIDDRKVVPEREAKSISHESTFAQDIEDFDILVAWMHELCDQVTRRMRAHKLVGRTIQIKLRYSNFDTLTRSATLPQATNANRSICETAVGLLHRACPLQHGVRLLGMGVAQLQEEAARQLSLFDDLSDERERRLDDATDRIREKFGKQSLTRGSAIEHQLKPRKPD